MTTDKKVKICLDNFTVKASGETDVVIEGYANKAVVDRGNDYIEPKAWNLGNYKKSGIILFNHDRDKPIGKAIDVKATDDGLYIKAKISKSKDPQIAMVRDLIREGILNAFSVGFNVAEEQKSMEGVNVIKSAELLETSVVTLPMNQDSLFSLTAKDLGSKEIRLKILNYKGAKVASAVHARLDELVDQGESSRADLLEKMAAAAEVDEIIVHKALAGDLAPMPESLVSSFASFLGLDEKALLTLNLTDSPGEPEVKKDEGAVTKEAAKESPDAPPPAAPMKKKNGQEAIGVYQIKLPKEDLPSEEEAIAYAEEYDWAAVSLEDAGDYWTLLQKPVDAFLGEDFAEIDLGDGVIALVGALKPEENDEEENGEKPEEGQMEEKTKGMGEEEKKPDKNPADEKKEDVSGFLAESQATEEGAPGNPPSWVADEALWEKAKRASEAALERIDYAFVVWWYLNNGGEKKGIEAGEEKQAEQVDGQMPSAVAMDTAAPVVDENPHLAQARQTNVLLGTLIALTQEMSKKLDGLMAIPAPMAEPAQPEAEEAKAEEQVDAELAKMLESVAMNLKSVNNSLGAFRA